jgi:O-antigen/teichoic acid export membrane protein
MRRIIFQPNRSRLRKILLYGVSRGTTDALLALRGLVLASLLGPEAFGGWALFRLATRYGAFAGLGVHRGLEFEVAKGRSADDTGATSVEVQFLHTAQGFGLLVFGTISLASLAASFLVEAGGLALAMRWFAAAIITEQLWLYGLVYLRARGHLRRYAAAELTNAALHVGFAALLAPFWGLGGAFAGFVLATFVSLALLTWHVRLRPAISGCHLGLLIRVGFPILVSLFLATVLATADRLVVAGYGGTSLLGLYAFGVSIAGLAGSFAWVVRTVVFPDVYSHAGGGAEEQALQNHLAETVMPFAWSIPPCLGVLAFVLNPMVSTVVPNYLDALPAARIFIFTGVTTGFASLGALGVVAAGRQKLLPVFSGIALVLNVTLSFAALRSGIGLPGVALGALVSSATFGIAILAIAARVARICKPARFVLRTALPLTWCVTSVSVIGTLRSDPGGLPTVVSLVLYVLSLLPLVPIMLTELRKVHWSVMYST